MKIDLNKYSVNKERAQQWYLERGYLDIKNGLSRMGIIYVVPFIVAAFWIGEITNWPEDIMKTIKRLQDFNHYEEILNKPESYPGDL